MRHGPLPLAPPEQLLVLLHGSKASIKIARVL
jgi:hypothetical protein